MAYNEQLTNRVREALASIPDVEEKRMFRGVAFMVNGKMCVTVGDDELMCRIDPDLHEEMVEKNGCRSVEMRGRQTKGYVYVSAAGLKTQKDFDEWIRLALDYNPRAKAAKKSKNKLA